MIKMILQAVLHSQEKNRKALLSNYWSSRESRDTFELKRPDRPTDGASFFFPSLFSSFFFFFFFACVSCGRREREREREAHVVRYIASFSSSSSSSAVVLRRPTSTEPEGRNLRQKQRKVVALQQQQPATPPPTNKQKKQTNKTSTTAQCSGSSTVHTATAARGRGSLPDILYMFITRRIFTEVNFFLSWSQWV